MNMVHDKYNDNDKGKDTRQDKNRTRQDKNRAKLNLINDTKPQVPHRVQPCKRRVEHARVHDDHNIVSRGLWGDDETSTGQKTRHKHRAKDGTKRTSTKKKAKTRHIDKAYSNKDETYRQDQDETYRQGILKQRRDI
jgi:hypothetical protein